MLLKNFRTKIVPAYSQSILGPAQSHNRSSAQDMDPKAIEHLLVARSATKKSASLGGYHKKLSRLLFFELRSCPGFRTFEVAMKFEAQLQH